ncbi:MAG: hypothetical protein IT536_06430 [Hyphomicrobiales bacterium]|nr:hypothetical protein [Hyphomicrobiales bacterium]
MAAEHEKPAAFLDDLLSPLRCVPPRRYDWLIELQPTSTVAVPDSGRRIFEGALPEGLPAVMLDSAGEQQLIVPDHLRMRFCRSQHRTAIDYVPGRETTLSGTAAFWFLGDMLVALGRHLLHGAMLVDPARDLAIALFAPSHTGKTTTALALAHAGYALAGDDALVLDADAQGCGLWAIPRMTKIHRRTAAMLPWLAPLLTDSGWKGEEQALRLASLAPAVALAGHRRRKVGLMVALTVPNESGHRLSRIPRPEALAAIAHDNLRIAPGGVDADTRVALAALSRLVATVPVVALSVGPEPASLSGALFDDHLLV